MKTTLLSSILFMFAFSNLINAQVFGKKDQIENLNSTVDSLKSIIFELEKNIAKEKEKSLALVSSKEKLESSLEKVESENLTLKNEKEEQIDVNKKLRKVNDSLFIAVENTILPVSIEEVKKVVNYDGYDQEFSVPHVNIQNEEELAQKINEEICLYTNLVSFYVERYEHQCSMGFWSLLDQLNEAQLKKLKTYVRPIPELIGAKIKVIAINNKDQYKLELIIYDEEWAMYTYTIEIDLRSKEKDYSINNSGYFKPHEDRGNC